MIVAGADGTFADVYLLKRRMFLDDGSLTWTEYDPYDPPIVGIAAQLYAVRGDAPLGRDAAVPDAAQARPFAVSAEGPALAPIADPQRVFDASHDAVIEDLKRFAMRDHELSTVGSLTLR